jgi:hypothetical protein
MLLVVVSQVQEMNGMSLFYNSPGVVVLVVGAGPFVC